MITPQGIDLDQYRTQAKEMLKRARSADQDAIERIRTHHPEHNLVFSRGDIRLADTQLVIAREIGFPSWAKLKEYLLFRNALRLLDAGGTRGLDAFLSKHPSVLRYRCARGECCEEGYFRGAALLHHVAGNPIRCPLPAGIVDVTQVLLAHGADPNAVTEAGWSTIGLILTGKQVADARVGVALIDILKAAGARDDLDHDDVLSHPLWNGGRATAEELVHRGAKMDLRHAAALGGLDVMKQWLATHGDDPTMVETALIYACHHGEIEAVRLLMEHGARGDVSIDAVGDMPHYAARATALHMAAWRGHGEIVRLLVASGARADVVEPTYGGTAIGWAEHAGHEEIATFLRQGLA